MEAVAKLVIKTPNQRYEDLQIDCDLGWTVKKLKDYLSDVYPTKPSSIAQRLIYAGHLLQDHLQLKEIFNKDIAFDDINISQCLPMQIKFYTGRTQENDSHTVHMVCAPTAEELGIHSHSPKTTKKKPRNTEEESENQSAPNSSLPIQDGLRHRRPSCTTGQKSTGQTASNNPTSTNQQHMAQWQQYMAHMQQYWMSMQQHQQQNGQYAHFMQQYQYLMSMQQFYPSMNYRMFGGDPFMPLMSPMSPVSPLTPPPTPPVTPVSPPPAQAIHEQNVQQPVEQPPAQPQAAPVRQNQNLRMNAQGAMFEDDEEDGEEGLQNRDWLDWIHTVMRAGVLISIMYFYSSTSRLLLVCVLGFIVYLYQGGWFNIRRNQAPQQQDAPREENNRIEENQNPDPLPDDQADGNQDGENSENNNVENSNRIPTERTENSPGLLSVIYTFFTSFFTSLVPQGPQALQQP